MSRHLQREIDLLKKSILSLSALVEENFQKSIASVTRRDVALADQVIAADKEIDRLEVEIEEECLKALALHQPVAADLRFIITVLKMDDELERIGDLAVHIAERGKELSGELPAEFPFDFQTMAEKVRVMLAGSIDSLVNLDTDLARQVWNSDDEVDTIHRGMYRTVKERLLQHPEELGTHLQTMAISRFLERMADHTTNIAKDVIYMTEGEIVRHRRKLAGGLDAG